MYKDLMHNPMQASPEEIQSLNLRRKEEKQIIIERDMDRVDDFQLLSVKDEQYWFMISSEWLYRWKCFVSNKVSSS